MRNTYTPSAKKDLVILVDSNPCIQPALLISYIFLRTCFFTYDIITVGMNCESWKIVT